MEELDSKNPYIIYYGDWFKKAFTNFVTDPKYGVAISKFLEKKYTISEIGESYRIINSWDSAGLLFLTPDRDSKWRRFNLVDYVWILIIRELKNIGFSTEKILNVKANLFYDFPETNDDLKLDFILFFMCQTLMNNDISLVVQPDGISVFVLDSQYFGPKYGIDPFRNNSSRIIISLNKILAQALNDPDIAEQKTILLAINNELGDLVTSIYAEDSISEISIKKKNGEIHKVHKKIIKKLEPKEPMTEIREMVKSNQNQDIIIRQQDGKVISVEQIIKT